MRIVIDGRMLYWTGVGRYTQALLEQLQLIDQTNEYFVLIRRVDWRLWEPTAPNFNKIEVNINPYSWGEQVVLPSVLRALRPDLVHFTAPNTPLLWRSPRLVTVHDLTLIDYNTSRFGGWRRALWQIKRLAFRLIFWNNAKFATHLITDTDYVKQQLIKRYKVSSGRISVAWLAADPQMAEPESTARFGLNRGYLLYVGNAYPYKNINSTIKALKLLDAYPQLELAVAGKRDAFSAESEVLAKHLGLGNRVKFLGFVSDGELINLYRGAKAYINPSLSEGFGLQGLEAMAQGTPVIAGRASCLPEVYGNAAIYFNPADSKDQALAISSVLSDSALSMKLQKAGKEKLQAFSWQQMANVTLNAYKMTKKTKQN